MSNEKKYGYQLPVLCSSCAWPTFPFYESWAVIAAALSSPLISSCHPNPRQKNKNKEIKKEKKTPIIRDDGDMR